MRISRIKKEDASLYAWYLEQLDNCRVPPSYFIFSFMPILKSLFLFSKIVYSTCPGKNFTQRTKFSFPKLAEFYLVIPCGFSRIDENGRADDSTDKVFKATSFSFHGDQDYKIELDTLIVIRCCLEADPTKNRASFS